MGRIYDIGANGDVLSKKSQICKKILSADYYGRAQECLMI